MWVQLHNALLVSDCLSNDEASVLWILNSILLRQIIIMNKFSQTLCITNCVDLFCAIREVLVSTRLPNRLTWLNLLLLN